MNTLYSSFIPLFARRDEFEFQSEGGDNNRWTAASTMTSAAGKIHVSIPTISLSDCFTPDGDIDPEKFIQRHQIMTQIESASEDDDSCNTTLKNCNYLIHLIFQLARHLPIALIQTVM